MSDDEILYPTPTLRVTDCKRGYLVDEFSGNSLPASDIAREIVSHFGGGGRWSEFPNKAKGYDTFLELIRAGILQPSGFTPSPPDLIASDHTMFDAPQRKLADVSSGDIVFVGAPIDIGTTAFPGTRFGPDAIRMASTYRYRCDFDLETGGLSGWNMPSLGGKVMTGARIFDLGDVRYAPGTAPQDFYARLRRVVEEIYAKGAFPVVLGGDHSISYSTTHLDADALVHLDAHSDMADFGDDPFHHHGNVITRLVTEGLAPQVFHIGLRDTSGSDTANAGSFAFSADPGAFPQILETLKDKRVFVSLDVDVLDPAVLPATGTPLPGGLQVRELCRFLAELSIVTKPLGLDVVELCPIRDEGDLSAQTIVEVILVFLAMYHKHHGKL